MEPGEELRRARERAGLTIEEAAARTRIPQRYLEALERGDDSAFGPGPFRTGYTRQYRAFLELDPEPAPKPARASRPPPEPERTVTVTTTTLLRQSRPRMLLLGGAAVLAGVLALAAGRKALAPTEAEVGEPPDQVVTLAAVDAVKATVEADGRRVFSGTLQPDAPLRVEAHDRIEVDLAELGVVTVNYNGHVLKPLGAQSRPRRLVFVDDAGDDAGGR